jgi:hypothetical protein
VETGNQAKWVELQTKAICKNETGENTKVILVIPLKQAYSKSKAACELLGGRFPVATNIEELTNLKSSVNLDGNNDRENITNNGAKYCKTQFWMPVVQKPGCNPKQQQCKWLIDSEQRKDEEMSLPWMPSQPNGGTKQKCVRVYFDELGFGDSSCDSHACTICQFDRSIDFHFRGLHRESVIDQNYIFVPKQQTSEGLIFVGHKTTRIYWSYSTNQWKIWDNAFTPHNLGSNNDPTLPEIVVGKIQWRLTRYWDSNDNTAELRDLKFSRVLYF